LTAIAEKFVDYYWPQVTFRAVAGAPAGPDADPWTASA
jgi:hypothetical protein